ncbi:MAG TPA: glycoside hydrolase family 2 TIM barrel-domain containing protein [Candidatus Sulfotelmatobacter sp.]|nr:glycoside hydrolase family 2 TIM barrel-domain containing protein [Candidatus Sulfotelmatobacter sp.]
MSHLRILVIRFVAIFLFAIPAYSASAGRSPRIETNFSTQWLYTAHDVAGGERNDLDDSGFEQVSVPHANVLLPAETFDPDSFRFVSWYRKHLKPGDSWRDQLVSLRFQGVMTVADVYLNGKHLATHKGGYTPFDVDLTNALKFGADNVIAVRVDSRVQPHIPPEGAPEVSPSGLYFFANNGHLARLAPKMYGYYLFGGIQRDVELRITNKLHIVRVYYVTKRVQPDAAVAAMITVRNDRASPVDASVRVRLRDHDRNEVASIASKVKLNAGEERDVPLSVDPISNPHLWSPDHPDRYIAEAEIADPAAISDREDTWIGLREIDWQDGVFHINGKRLQLRGLNRHQTYPFIGGSVPNRLQRRDALTLKYGLGVNAVRSSHYPPDPEFLDECDRLGILVMDEFPSWQYVGKDAEWKENAVRATREMILRDRNHPSVFVWGVRANEGSFSEGDDRDLYDKTYGLVRQLDPSRPPGGARLTEGWHGKMVPEEVLTVNDYSEPFPLPATDKPWLISEFGSARQFPVWEDEDALLAQSNMWMGHFDALYAHPEMSGAIGWAAFDYSTPEFNAPVGATAYHCVEDIYRLPKGFVAYALASQMDPDLYGPMVHILSYWEQATPELLVASNAEEVEVRINGKSIGRQRATGFTHLPHPLFKFKLGDAYRPGVVEAWAYRHGEVVAHQKLLSPQAAKRLTIVTDDASIVADGGDATRVVVYAMDSNGTVVPYEDRRISIHVEHGKLLGMPTAHLEGGRIAFYVQAQDKQREPITVHVAADGLEAADASVAVEEANEALPFAPFDQRVESLKFVPAKF